MIMKDSVRPLAEADLKAILEIEKQCFPIPWSADHFRHELANPIASLIGCDVARFLAGYICYWLIAGEMEILNVAVDPSYQRQGIAGALLAEAFRQCQGKGLDSAWLEVRAGNAPAIGLYEQFGFIVNGQRKRYYKDGEDALLMMRTFERP